MFQRNINITWKHRTLFVCCAAFLGMAFNMRAVSTTIKHVDSKYDLTANYKTCAGMLNLDDFYDKTGHNLTFDFLADDVDDKIEKRKLQVSYAKDYRSPCWFEPILESHMFDVESHPYVKYFQWHDRLKNRFTGHVTHVVDKIRAKCNATDGAWRLRCLPYLYVIGQFKSGTNSFWKTIRSGEIVRAMFKEPQYWNAIRSGGHILGDAWTKHMDLLSDINPPRPISSYVDLFDNAAENAEENYVTLNNAEYHGRIIVESSPVYLSEFDKWEEVPGNQGLSEPKFTVAHQIKSLTPQAHIIVLLRDPVERLYSQYFFFLREQNKSAEDFDKQATESMDLMSGCLKTRSLRSCVYDHNTISNYTLPATVRHSMYYPFVKDWLDVFGEQMLVLRSEDYYSNQPDTMVKVHRFLGLDAPEKVTIGTKNMRKKSSNMLPSTRHKLKAFLQPYNEQLRSLLNDDAFLWEEK